jgi:hypothetical protein
VVGISERVKDEPRLNETKWESLNNDGDKLEMVAAENRGRAECTRRKQW